MNMKSAFAFAANPLDLLGKLMLAALFWWDAIFLFIPNFQDTVAYIGQSNLPFPYSVAVITTLFLIVAPAVLFIKSFDVFALIALALFCTLTALIFHPYWTFAAEDRASEQLHFMKDLALAGAMCIAAGQKIQRP